MELLKLIVVLNYSEVPPGIDFKNKLLQILTGKSNQKLAPPPIVEGLQIRIKNKKMFFNVSSNKTGFEINQPTNKDFAILEAMSFFKTVFNTLQWKTVDRIGVRTQWIKPSKSTIENLISIYKEKFFKDVAILKSATDVGIALNFKDGERKINFSVGPMKKKQVVDMFLPPAPFDESTIPDAFSYVDYDYYFDSKSKYRNSDLENFIKHGIYLAEAKVKEVENAIGEI